MINRRLSTLSVFAVLFLVSCSGQPAGKTDAPAQPAAQGAQQPGTQAAAPAAAATATGPDAPAPQSITGVVVETMDASNYTYVRVKSSTAEVWAATAQFKVAVGEKVVVPLEVPMQNFESKSLKRTFPLIYFVPRIAREGEPAPAAPAADAAPAMMSSHTAAGGSPSTSQAAKPVAKVDPAPGGMTVADVWAKRKTLGGKSITVRGQVVKFNGAIMGRNWIHIQDGSGSAKDGTHDLTITSDAAAKVGDIITVTGKAAIDKDFGAGYAYPVILEGAAIVLK